MKPLIQPSKHELLVFKLKFCYYLGVQLGSGLLQPSDNLGKALQLPKLSANLVKMTVGATEQIIIIMSFKQF